MREFAGFILVRKFIFDLLAANFFFSKGRHCDCDPTLGKHGAACQIGQHEEKICRPKDMKDMIANAAKPPAEKASVLRHVIWI